MERNQNQESSNNRQTVKSNPIGYIQLDSGLKAIEVMNDIFTNYHFEKKEYWEDLRSIANIFICGYASECPETLLEPIEGEISVETQYIRFKDPDKKTDRQDFKLTNKKITFMELQNKAYTDPPIEERATGYYGMGIAHGGGKITNQMWLMAEDLRSVMHSRKYMNYILTDEQTGIKYPKSSGILFVSLTKISEDNSAAGELARFLIGKTADVESIKDSSVKAIATGLNEGFGVFKEDKSS